jgi:hypothetical protein
MFPVLLECGGFHRTEYTQVLVPIQTRFILGSDYYLWSTGREKAFDSNYPLGGL